MLRITIVSLFDLLLKWRQSNCFINQASVIDITQQKLNLLCLLVSSFTLTVVGSDESIQEL